MLAVKNENSEMIGSFLQLIDVSFSERANSADWQQKRKFQNCFDEGIRLQMTKILQCYLSSAENRNGMAPRFFISYIAALVFYSERKRRFKTVTSLGGTQVFLKVPLSITGKDPTTQELVKNLTEIYWTLQTRGSWVNSWMLLVSILIRFCPFKDKSFAGKFRLSGVLKLYCQWACKNMYPTQLVPIMNLIIQTSWNHREWFHSCCFFGFLFSLTSLTKSSVCLRKYTRGCLFRRICIACVDPFVFFLRFCWILR